MTTTEIKALVAAKLAGQGSAIDAGNAIPAVIEALCDHIDAQEQKLAKAVVPIEVGPGTDWPMGGDFPESKLAELRGHVLQYNGKDFFPTFCENNFSDGEALPTEVWVNFYQIDENGDMNEESLIVATQDPGNEIFYLVFLG